jgi:hypothetical protein
VASFGALPAAFVQLAVGPEVVEAVPTRAAACFFASTAVERLVFSYSRPFNGAIPIRLGNAFEPACRRERGNAPPASPRMISSRKEAGEWRSSR